MDHGPMGRESWRSLCLERQALPNTPAIMQGFLSTSQDHGEQVR